VLTNDSACYLFTRWDVMELWRQELEKVGFVVKHRLIWDKMIHGMGDLEGDWGDETEDIIYAVKGRHKLNIPPRPISPIRVQKVAPGNMVHPTEKPLGVWHPMIKASTSPGDLILDPWTGSCSLPLAARQLSRRVVATEIDIQWLQAADPRLRQLELFR
jgi:adenine-specific DNA-methyltransferase